MINPDDNDDNKTHVSDVEAAREQLQKAYLLISFGHLERATAICDDVDKTLPDHPLPSTMKGAFLLAAGQPQAALKHLGKVMRRFPDSALTRLYFCEACFLAGRVGRGLKELNKLDDLKPCDEDLRTFARSIRELFSDFDPATTAVPVVVNLNEVSESP